KPFCTLTPLYALGMMMWREGEVAGLTAMRPGPNLRCPESPGRDIPTMAFLAGEVKDHVAGPGQQDAPTLVQPDVGPASGTAAGRVAPPRSCRTASLRTVAAAVTDR